MSLKTFLANTFRSKTCERLSPTKLKESAAERAAKITAKSTTRAAWIGLFGVVITGILGFLGYKWYYNPNDGLKKERVEINKIADNVPTGLEFYPNIDEIREVPTKEQVGSEPTIKPDTVVFTYRNATGIPMRLILLDWYYHYYPITDPMAPSKAWRFWDFPNNNKDSTFSEFKRSTGWYTFFVLRLDTGERWQLGTKNIFYSEWPYLIVEKKRDKNEPFKAIFISSGESDVPK